MANIGIIYDGIISARTYLEIMTCKYYCLRKDNQLEEVEEILNMEFGEGKFLNYPLEKIKEVIGENCSVVRVKAKIHNEVCAFLRKGKCGIHEAKPAVCALFPLGRAVSPTGEIRYFLQEIECVAKDTKIKVRDWLEMFRLKETEEPARLWAIASTRLGVAKQKCKINPEAEDTLNQLLYGILYLAYDTNCDFISRFKKNAAAAEIVFEKITGKSVEEMLKGTKLYSFSDIKYETEK